MEHNYNGAFTALVTPFTANNEVDTSALRRLVQFQLAGGIDGLVSCGTTGEASTLSDAEYEQVVRTVVDEAAGKVTVIAGAGSNDTQKAIRLSQIAQSSGADALLHVTPYYNKPTPLGLIAHFTAIASATNLPIIIYNVPCRTGLNIKSDTLLRLIHTVPSIVGIKEASGDVAQVMDIIAKVPSNFTVLSGDDKLTLPILAIGGRGSISVVSNEIPGQFTNMVHTAMGGDWAKARSIHYQWFDLMEANFIETNPTPVKTALARMGKINEIFRLPITAMKQDNSEKLVNILKGHKLI